MEKCQTWENRIVWHKDWPYEIYVAHWPIFCSPLILFNPLRIWFWWMNVLGNNGWVWHKDWCHKMGRAKRICVFEHSVMTNFNCACPAIQRGQGSGFLSEGSSWFTACMSEQRRFWRDCADAQARLNLRCSHRR